MSSYFGAAERCGWNHDKAVAARATSLGYAPTPADVKLLPGEPLRDEHRSLLRQRRDEVALAEAAAQEAYDNARHAERVKAEAAAARAAEATAAEKARQDAARAAAHARHHQVREAKRRLKGKYGDTFLATPDSEDSTDTDKDEEAKNPHFLPSPARARAGADATATSLVPVDASLTSGGAPEAGFEDTALLPDAAAEYAERHRRHPRKDALSRTALLSKMAARLAAASVAAQDRTM